VLIDVEISVFQHSCCFDLQLIYAVIMSFIIQMHFFLEEETRKCCICCHVTVCGCYGVLDMFFL